MLRRILFIFTILICCIQRLNAQCTSSSGTPLINETFGAGVSTLGQPLAAGITNLQYVPTASPNDGQYCIVNYTSGCWSNGWHTVTDHTGDPNGYFMLVNASYEPSDFYVQTVDGLCPGTTYEFSSWVLNMLVGDGILPNITFTIEKTDGTILSTYDSGDIPVINPATWKRYGFFFTTPTGISTVVIRMHNNAPGGGGNDLALDDIGFTPAGPLTTVSVDGYQGSNVHVTCNKPVNFSSVVASCYVKNTYQWQTSTDQTNWTDIAGAVNATYNPGIQNAGTYYFRLSLAENGNIGNVGCRANSNVITITYDSLLPPFATTISAAICDGAFYTLPSGKQINVAGTYTDTLTTQQGCDSLVTIVNLSVTPKVYSSLTATICQGSSYLGYSSSGTFVDTLTAGSGCDSIRTIHLTVLPVVYSTLNLSICQGASYYGHSSSGTYIDTLQTGAGCDSIRTLNLTVNQPVHTIVNAVVCQGTSYLGYTNTGTYNDTFTGMNGCDSIRTLNLTVTQWLYSSITTSICQGTDYYGHNTTGTYIDTLKTATGCDSIRTLNLTVNSRPAPKLGTNTLLCISDSLTLYPGNFTHYLWQDGSTASSFKVTNGGKYWVQVTNDSGCEAADTIVIKKVYCGLKNIANSITPNGDGINDVWNIYDLQFYPDCTVSIFARNGLLVFRSNGYPKPWDGRYNGKLLPFGTYYYIIDLKNGIAPISGYIALIR